MCGKKIDVGPCDKIMAEVSCKDKVNDTVVLIH